MAVVSGKFEGTEKVLANINLEVNRIKGRTKRGMALLGIKVQEKTLPITPYDEGNLFGSIDQVVGETFMGPHVTIYFDAIYAPYVHEMTGEINWTTSGTGAKFLEKGLTMASKEALQILARVR
jgi:hypothetical protein